ASTTGANSQRGSG
nr:Chain P, ALA-SER-THR-THR-GLY-ALA-ASN-SER-GLN-ARG-GLY-SER-GLY [Porphyromonas gingivalis W83]